MTAMPTITATCCFERVAPCERACASIDFTRKRKNDHPTHYAQTLRVLKYWRRLSEKEESMPLPGFGMDLIATSVIDDGTDPSDYPQALQSVFSYIVKAASRSPSQ
jgi:hypothetical protein